MVFFFGNFFVITWSEELASERLLMGWQVVRPGQSSKWLQCLDVENSVVDRRALDVASNNALSDLGEFPDGPIWASSERS